MNIEMSFRVKARVYGAELLPTPEELAEAVREILKLGCMLDEVTISDLKLEVIDES